LDLENFQLLFTREGKWALESAEAFEPREKDFLGEFKMLAKRFPRDLARAALETAILRGEAGSKFPKAGKMYFTREALEQASPWEVAQHRAGRYAKFDHAADLGCSIGSDSLALAAVCQVTGIDNDPLRLAMAQANAEALGVNASFLEADLTGASLRELLPGVQALFFDPARRKDHQRAFSVEDYHPPLSILKDWLADFPALGVKVSPAVDLAELEGYDCEVEFISLNGNLKEAVLWFGPLKEGHSRQATLLPGPHTLTEDPAAEQRLSEPGAYLYEPDAAVLRAGLVTTLGAQLGAAQLDPEIAYLTADSLTETPFARVWQVEDWMPFQLKRLRTHLRECNIGRVTVKKRGSPIVPEELIQELRLEGEEERVLFLTQLKGKPIVIIAKVE